MKKVDIILVRSEDFKRACKILEKERIEYFCLHEIEKYGTKRKDL